MLALLMACDDDPGRERADAFLEAHPKGTAIVQYGVETDRFEGVTGTAWRGADLAEWLAPCAPVAAFETRFTVRAGGFPWEIDDEDVPACVRERLATFPFDEPLARGERDHVYVRWRPDLPTRALSTATPRPPVPFAVTGRGVRWELQDGRLRFRHGEARPLEDAEGWARQLTCPAETLGLVRTVVEFDDGEFEDVETFPRNVCVELKARSLAGGPSLIVLDVPVGPWG